MSQENVEAVPQESIVLATFKDRFAAERMLASLGRTFRREALAGKARMESVATTRASWRFTSSTTARPRQTGRAPSGTQGATSFGTVCTITSLTAR